MIEGVDYSDGRPSPAGLVNVGKHFAGRYVGAGFGPKMLLKSEAVELSDAGLMIVSLVEGASDGALGGYGAGVQHATQARQWHANQGFPWPVPCYFAVDFDVTAEQWPTVASYLEGAASVIGLPFVGIYGGIRAMEWAQRDDVASWFFQTYAWSGGLWAPGVHIEQYQNDVYIVGGTVDLDRAPTVEYGGWNMTSNPPPAQPTTDSQKLDWLVWSVGRGAPVQPPGEGNEAITYWAGHVTTRLAALQAAVDALAAHEGTTPPACDLTPVLTGLTALSNQMSGLGSGATVDAVAVAKALAADPALVAQLGQAVAAQLAAIQGEITLSGTLAATVKPPTP